MGAGSFWNFRNLCWDDGGAGGQGCCKQKTDRRASGCGRRGWVRPLTGSRRLRAAPGGLEGVSRALHPSTREAGGGEASGGGEGLPP